MTDERNRYQITRIDARSCFVESLSDAFDFGKVHLTFCSYDKHKPEGQRMTDSIQIYIDIADWLELCRMLDSGELRCLLRQKSKAGDRDPIKEWLGGTSARKLAGYGSPRPDGKSLSRTAQLFAGSRADSLLFVANSGPGEENATGLIVPKFGKNPEQHVAVSMSFDGASRLLLLTRIHYSAWLTARYLRETIPMRNTAALKQQTPSPGREAKRGSACSSFPFRFRHKQLIPCHVLIVRQTKAGSFFGNPPNLT